MTAIEFHAGMMQAHADGWYLNGVHALSGYRELAPFVYYIQEGPFVKIGTSVDPERRCDQLRRAIPGKSQTKLPSTWSGQPELLAYHRGSAYAETAMHHRFAHLRNVGEWFHLTAELEEHICDVATQQALQEIEVSEAKRKRLLDQYDLTDTLSINDVIVQRLASCPRPDMSLIRDTA